MTENRIVELMNTIEEEGNDSEREILHLILELESANDQRWCAHSPEEFRMGKCAFTEPGRRLIEIVAEKVG